MFPKGTFRNVPTETHMKPTKETTKQKKGLQPNKLFTKPTLKRNNTKNNTKQAFLGRGARIAHACQPPAWRARQPFCDRVVSIRRMRWIDRPLIDSP